MELEIQHKEQDSVYLVRDLGTGDVFVRKQDLDDERIEDDDDLEYYMKVAGVTKEIKLPTCACVNLLNGLLYYFCEDVEVFRRQTKLTVIVP